MSIGLGIVTWRRPDFFLSSAMSAVRHVGDHATLYAYNDGSNPDSYANTYRQLEGLIDIHHEDTNRGVAFGKNFLLRKMMENGVDYLFLMEDDIEIISPDVLHDYIEASNRTGIEHFNFAHHGPANVDNLVEYKDGVDYYLNGVGAFSFYTRRVIETVGYFDVNMLNAYEHLEHTHRVAKAGLTSPFWRFADLSHSKLLLREIAHHSVIGGRQDWAHNVAAALRYWRGIDPDCPI